MPNYNCTLYSRLVDLEMRGFVIVPVEAHPLPALNRPAPQSNQIQWFKTKNSRETVSLNITHNFEGNSRFCWFSPLYPLKKKQTEEKANVVAAVWGTEIIQFLASLQTCSIEWIEERMLGRMVASENGWSSSSHHTNHHPSQMDVLPKDFLQIILGANG